MFSTLLTPIIVYNSIIFITFAAAYKQIIMMKKILLLFFIFILTLLGSGSAWADETVETYDFQSYSLNGVKQTNAVTNYGGSANIRYNQHDLTYISSFYWNGIDVPALDLNGRIAAFGVWNIRKLSDSDGGLYSPDSGPRELSILNLCNGDKVSIITPNTQGTVTFVSSNAKTSNGTTASGAVQSGEEYTMTADGHLDLVVDRNNWIHKIVITHTNGTPSISFDTSGKTGDDTYNNVTLPYYSTQLSKRDFTEPTLTVFPSTASVTYSVENYRESVNDKAVAIMNDNPTDFGDVMLKNIGWCKVTATAIIGGQSYSDSYLVWVWDNLAEYTIEDSGKKYKLTGAGVLANRYVTAVTGMEMGFGNINNNSAVVINQDDHFVSYMAADNGWWDRFPYDNGWPSQGTYYTFKATADGVLTFGGYKASTGGSVIIKNTTTGEEMTTTTIFDEDSSGHLTSGNITMKAGQTYYMHGTTPVVTEGTNPWDSEYANLWAVFELEWFKFVADFKIVESTESSVEASYGMASTCGATAVTSREVLTGVTLSQVSVFDRSYKGSVQSADVAVNTSTGALEFTNITYKTDATNGKGGAIKVTLKFGESYIDYVMTIPYGEHVWDFRKDGEQGTRKGDWTYTDAGLVSMMNSNGTDWSRVFKVASKSGGEWTELIDPIMAARGSINGNNAFYMDNTAGLVFVTGPESFGAHETSNSTANYSSLTNDQKYNLSYTTTSGADLLWMKGTATIFFPGVAAGQYIKIYTYRHSDNKGENFYAKNLVDLDDKTYNTTSAENFFKLRGINDNRYPAYKGDDIKGAAIFRVPTDYKTTNNPSAIPSLTLCDDGWAHIYRIEIMSNYEPDLILTMDGAKDVNGNTINLPVDYNSPLSSITVRKKMNAGGTYDYTPVTKTFTATPGNTRCQSANTCRYVVDATGLTVTTTRSNFNSGAVDYNKLELTFGGGTGLVKITQREIANHTGYAYNNTTGTTGDGEFTIDKNEYYLAVGELTVQDYPFTWDFTAYNKYSNTASQTALATASEAPEGTFGKWSWDNNSPVGYTQNISASVPMNGHATLSVNKPIAIQGSELTALTTPLREMEGLGISLPYSTTNSTYTTFYTENSSFGKHEHGYQVYNITGNIKNTQEDLRGVGTITIPEVNNGMYIFVKASSEPTVKVGETTLTKLTGNDDIFSVAEGVYLYKQTVSGNQDVEVAFANGTNVETVAVTNIEKSINALGYATESRNHPIDHTYQAKLTTHPVKAYAITTYEGTTYNYRGYPEVKKSEPVSVVPATTGIVLYQENASAAFTSPLFYPAVNVGPTETDNAILETNWMAPNVESKQHWSETICKYYAMAGATGGTGDNGAHQASEHSGQDCLWCTKFIMTRKYYTYKKKDKTSTEHDESTNVEAFYRLKINTTETSHNVIAANKAYLLIPTDKLPKALWADGDGTGTAGKAPAGVIYMDLADITGEDDETTAIDYIIREEGEAINGQDVYYSLSGVRIIGTPTTKGIYIKNGKKVSIK